MEQLFIIVIVSFVGELIHFFVPPCVGFINAFPLMKQYGVQFMVIGIGTTILVMVSTGWVWQAARSVQGTVFLKLLFLGECHTDSVLLTQNLCKSDITGLVVYVRVLTGTI